MTTLKLELAQKIYNNDFEASHDNVYNKISKMIEWAWDNWSNDDWEELRTTEETAPLGFIEDWLENWCPEDDGFDTKHVNANL